MSFVFLILDAKDWNTCVTIEVFLFQEPNMVGPSPIKKPPKIAPKKVLGGDSVKDQLSEDLRQAIWPLYDDELFIKILNQNPDIMTFKSGPSQETLLHR